MLSDSALLDSSIDLEGALGLTDWEISKAERLIQSLLILASNLARQVVLIW